MRNDVNNPRPIADLLWRAPRLALLASGLCVLLSTGCTGPLEYVRNGFKVGPNYREPPAPLAEDWIKTTDWVDPDDSWVAEKNKNRVRSDMEAPSRWWMVFDDPVLEHLIAHAYHENLTLRQAAYQVLAARAQLGISIGNFLPQTQTASGYFQRNANSKDTAFSAFIPKRFYNQWEVGFNLAWELDIFGKFRRGIESSKDSYDASIFNYDDVLVSLLSEVAINYVQLRVYEERIRYARENVALQQKAVKKVEDRKDAGLAKQVDVDQINSVLYQTWAMIPQLEIGLRTTNNQLCLLLGVPPEELRRKLGPPNPRKPIPTPPPEAAVGIPANLLRRRPDVREAERQAAAQCAQIGYAESFIYPAIAIDGSFTISSERFQNLWKQNAIGGGIGPAFSWPILNYGRIVNNVRVQDATFQALVAQYQNTVLTAQQEVENGLVTFLKGLKQVELQSKCVKFAEDAKRSTLDQYEAGIIDISQVILILQNLTIYQDTLAQALGVPPTGLIQVYTALGGGWELRETGYELPDMPTPPGAAPTRAKHRFVYPRVLDQSYLPVMAPAQQLPQPQTIPALEPRPQQPAPPPQGPALLKIGLPREETTGPGVRLLPDLPAGQ